MNADISKAHLLIVGAGPAGCAAAIHARQSGLCVVMLDASPQPKSAPGETLHPGIEPIFKQLGVLDAIFRAGFQRHLGIWMEHSNQRVFAPYGEDENGPWRGFQVDRRKFHQILQQAALDSGAKLIRNASPQSVLMAEGRMMGVVVDGHHIRADWTIDATGRSAWLARQLGLPAYRLSPSLRVRFGWAISGWKYLEGQPLFVFRDDGWDWQAPIGNKRVAWVKLRIGGNNVRSAGIDLTWQFRPDCAGQGFFLLGDAAATLDPSSSHGVLRAMMSGILASHLAAGCLEKNLTEQATIESYRSWLRTQFEYDVKHLRQKYANAAPHLTIGHLS